jgi:hypothetical protein
VGTAKITPRRCIRTTTTRRRRRRRRRRRIEII